MSISTPSESLLTTAITGVRIHISPYMIPALLNAMVSAEMVDNVLGVISPKTRISRVRTPVAIPIALFPKTFMVKVVSRDDADRLTILLPIKIALNILLCCSITFDRTTARSTPDSARVRTLILFTVVRAVSDDEKNADNANNITNTSNCMTSLESKKNHSL